MSGQFIIWVMILQTVILIVMAWMLIASRKRMSVAPFWEVLQTQMADSLHHPHPESRELDKLLEELEALTLTPGRRLKLESLLRQKAADTKEGKDERNRAEFLLFAMREVVSSKKAALK